MADFGKEMEKRGITNSDELYDAVNDGIEILKKQMRSNSEMIAYYQKENRKLVKKLTKGAIGVNKLSKAIAAKA